MDIKSNKGISLVEVIATVAIIGIIMAPISLVFITAYTNFVSESDKASAEQFAREILYGKGINSYGVIGDLERCNVTGSEIKIGINDTTTTASSIRIPYTYLDENKVEQKGTKEYRLNSDNSTLEYSDAVKSGDYFDGEKSTNGKDVRITSFVAGKRQKGSVINSINIDTYVIEVSVTVETGKSGPVKLESSYRINVED